MNLLDVVARSRPIPRLDGEKIPWNEPAFSARMLREHLTQAHDAASRRFAIIDQHVAWIQTHLLCGRKARILDLGCGPGLYLNRLAWLGNTGMGVDFSPASIEYAASEARRDELPVLYQLGDLRSAQLGDGYDLAMLLFGEFNTFRPEEAQAIVQRACAALRAGGCLLLEPNVFAAVQALGEQPPTWYASQSGLFSERPHLCLQDNAWDAMQRTSIERYAIVDAETGSVTQWGTTTQAYTERDFQEFLRVAGFERIEFYPSLVGEPVEHSAGFLVVVGRKEESR